MVDSPPTPLAPRRVPAGESLADILERVLDKGVVITGDISIALVGVELLTIKLRLLIASADKAQEMGIDWWTRDPFLSGAAVAHSEQIRLLEEQNRDLLQRLAVLEEQAPAEHARSTREETARPRKQGTRKHER